jgi:hypothetical protein
MLIATNLFSSSAIQFSQEQRDYIAYTLEREKGQKDDSASMSVWTGLAQATLDPKTWMLLGILFSTYVYVHSPFPSSSPPSRPLLIRGFFLF